MHSPINRTARTEKGFVYVVSAPNGYVKIGKASNPFERFTMIQCNSPLPVVLAYVCDCPYPVDIEIAVHQALVIHRRHREWFEVSVDEAIEAVRSAVKAAGSTIATAPHRSRKPRIGGAPAIHRPLVNEIAAPFAP